MSLLLCSYKYQQLRGEVSSFLCSLFSFHSASKKFVSSKGKEREHLTACNGAAKLPFSRRNAAAVTAAATVTAAAAAAAAATAPAAAAAAATAPDQQAWGQTRIHVYGTSRRTLSQFLSFKIRRLTLLNCMKFADLLISRL